MRLHATRKMSGHAIKRAACSGGKRARATDDKNEINFRVPGARASVYDNFTVVSPLPADVS